MFFFPSSIVARMQSWQLTSSVEVKNVPPPHPYIRTALPVLFIRSRLGLTLGHWNLVPIVVCKRVGIQMAMHVFDWKHGWPSTLEFYHCIWWRCLTWSSMCVLCSRKYCVLDFLGFFTSPTLPHPSLLHVKWREDAKHVCKSIYIWHALMLPQVSINLCGVFFSSHFYIHH